MFGGRDPHAAPVCRAKGSKCPLPILPKCPAALKNPLPRNLRKKLYSKGKKKSCRGEKLGRTQRKLLRYQAEFLRDCARHLRDGAGGADGTKESSRLRSASSGRRRRRRWHEGIVEATLGIFGTALAGADGSKAAQKKRVFSPGAPSTAARTNDMQYNPCPPRSDN